MSEVSICRDRGLVQRHMVHSGRRSQPPRQAARALLGDRSRQVTGGGTEPGDDGDSFRQSKRCVLGQEARGGEYIHLSPPFYCGVISERHAQMLAFIQAQYDIVERILRHIETPPFADLLVRIIQLDEHPAGAGVLEVCTLLCVMCAPPDPSYPKACSGCRRRA